ncbi:MAG: hypothetical protein AABX10_00915 [Nanoarchaeota archaeon]
MEDIIRKVQEKIVSGIANDGKPPEAIRSLYEMSRHIPTNTRADEFARAVDGLVDEEVTPAKSTGYIFNPERAKGIYI